MINVFSQFICLIICCCFLATSHSIEITGSLSADEDSFETQSSPTSLMVRYNACGDLRDYWQKEQLRRQLALVNPIEVSFPVQKEELLQAINRGYQKFAIHIPRFTDDGQRISFDVDQAMDLRRVYSIAIYSSAGESRGYWRSAVQSLSRLIQRLPNLLEVTLSEHIVEDLMPFIPVGTHIHLNYYTYGDTIYSELTLQARALSSLAYYQANYRSYPFYLVPIRNPIADSLYSRSEEYQNEE